MTVAEAAGISYDQLGEFIGEDGFFQWYLTLNMLT